MRFEFSTASQVLFGAGTLLEVPALASSLGKCALVLTDSITRVEILCKELKTINMAYIIFKVKNEPIINDVIMAMRIFVDNGCDVAIGCGGGSTIDTGKAALALVSNPGDPLDYFDIIGTGRPLKNPSLPYIAIPTTAGTGAEVTRNAVIAFPDRHVKVSLRSPFLSPRIAVVDPELTYSLPPFITASTGFDALTQLIEPYLCNSPTPLTDALCRDGLNRISNSFFNAYSNGLNLKVREDMSLASLFGGMALANSRLGAIHGLAGPLGGMYPVPHGLVCAILLPYIMEINLRALRSRESDSLTLRRFEDVAHILTHDPNSTAEDGITFIYDLRKKMSIPTLSEYGLNSRDFPDLIALAQKSSSMKGNPINLTDKELFEVLEKAGE